MKVFVLSLLIAVLSVSAFAQAKSGIEGVWQLTEVTMKGDGGMAMPAAAAATSVTAASAGAAKSSESMTMKVTQPSMYLFTKTHYSIIYVAAHTPRPLLEDYNKASQEELVSIFVEGFVANAGTYEVKAGKLTVHPMVAKSPSYMKEGTWATSSMTIKGNEMTLVSESSNSGPSKNPTTYKLTRVE